MPRNVQEAFKKGTRSPDGNPGKNYWQNFGRYDIIVSASPPNRLISGREKIAYINNSPDTLGSIVFRLIQNIHKPEAQRYADVDSNFFNSGIHIDSMYINGVPYSWRDPQQHFTWEFVNLSLHLLPHDSIHFSILWHYTLPLEGGREGMIDSTTFFLAYFYPRVAVYDDYNGWDRINFIEAHEFYNDFNNYTLTVVVPKNFIVWATGNLQNSGDVLQPAFVQLLQESFGSDSIIHIAKGSDLSKKNITAQHDFNSWKWKADSVSDVAVGISDHFAWDASSTIVDQSTQRRASVQSAYNDTALDFHHAVEVGKEGLQWLSIKLPGVPYPYPKMTIFQGYYDMEYPMMVNDKTNKNLPFSRLIENHEIAHTYFPFYMGTNESRYAFMDEGWATTFEYLIAREQESPASAEATYERFRIKRWISDNSMEGDLPIITPSNVLNSPAYGINAYGKASLAYLATKDLLGDELFKKCLLEYMRRWHGKHPIPWDFFNSFSNISGRNLDWFWNNWFFSNNYIDLGIEKVQSGGKGYTISIQNMGGFAIPFDLKINYADSSNEVIHETPVIWSGNQKEASVNISTRKKISSVQIMTDVFLDADQLNNIWKR